MGTYARWLVGLVGAVGVGTAMAESGAKPRPEEAPRVLPDERVVPGGPRLRVGACEDRVPEPGRPVAVVLRPQLHAFLNLLRETEGPLREATQKFATTDDGGGDPDWYAWCAAASDAALVYTDGPGEYLGFLMQTFDPKQLPFLREPVSTAGAARGVGFDPRLPERAFELDGIVDVGDARRGAGTTVYVVDTGTDGRAYAELRTPPVSACFTGDQCPGATPSQCVGPNSGTCADCSGVTPSQGACGHGTAIHTLIGGNQKVTVGGRFFPLPSAPRRTSVAPEAAVVPIRVLTDSGLGQPTGTDADLIRALDWIARREAPPSALPKLKARTPLEAGERRTTAVVNLSLTLDGPGSLEFCNRVGTELPTALQAAIDALDALGVLVVAAAGPAVQDLDGSTLTRNGRPTFSWAPACAPSVLAVGATDRHGALSAWSNPGDVLGPGSPTAVLPQLPDYPAAAGTSYAAAYVSGAAAAQKGSGGGGRGISVPPPDWAPRLAAGGCAASPLSGDTVDRNCVLDLRTAPPKATGP